MLFIYLYGVCIDGTRAQWFDAILHDFLAVWFYTMLYTMRCTECAEYTEARY